MNDKFLRHVSQRGPPYNPFPESFSPRENHRLGERLGAPSSSPSSSFSLLLPAWFPIVDDDISTFERRPGDHGARFKSWFTGTPIDTRIMYTLNSYANARKEPREDNTTTSNTGNPAASVYTLRPVFCILSSELIQSRGPPGDFRCGEIVIGRRRRRFHVDGHSATLL